MNTKNNGKKTKFKTDTIIDGNKNNELYNNSNNIHPIKMTLLKGQVEIVLRELEF